MAVFSVLTGLFIATANPIVLALIYIPVICGSALVIGPVQSFALSKLSYQLNPHGVTVMSTASKSPDASDRPCSRASMLR